MSADTKKTTRLNSPPAANWGAWTDAATALPDDDTLVLLALNDDDVWPGYRDGDIWRYVDAMPIAIERVTHWMHFPPPPERNPLERSKR